MPCLRLGLLGSLQVFLDDKPIATFGSDKARALLIYLAVEASYPHRRDELIGLLWPDYPEETARHNLRQTLHNVRCAIGDRSANPPHLIVRRDEIQFNPASEFALDVAAFNAHLAACNEHKHPQEVICADCASRLEQAVELYHGRFLQQFFLEDSAEFEEWALVQRERLHRCVLEALAHLVDYHEQHADYRQARRYALRQLELEPWREEAHRQMMRVLALSGERSAALLQYETCRRVLADELGVEPSAETRELHAQISRAELTAKRGELSSVPPIILRPLPLQLTPFIGREREMADLERLIADPQCRLVTLVGTGGIGKTRLALQAATVHRQAFAHGAAFVPLASADSTVSIIPAIADALGLVSSDANDPQFLILKYLRDKQMLLVLDNIEHLLDGVGLFVEILKHAPAVMLLCTSRELLHLQSEWVFEVEGLPIPANEQTEKFEDYGAVALFVQHARRARVGYALTAEERSGVARICRLVGGMPLGLELAATWVRILSTREIADQIERNVDFLETSKRDLPERHRSMRAVIDQSWNMLTPKEQHVICRLSVFHGFSQEAAEQVAGASLSILASLVTKSLVRRASGDRYDLHDLVRQYARERLIESGEFEVANGQHLRFFLDLAEVAEPKLQTAKQPIWLNRLDVELDNLRGALDWSLRYGNGNAKDVIETGLRLASALWQFWLIRGHVKEGRQWLALALEKSSGNELGTSLARAKALVTAVGLADFHGDLSSTIPLCEEALAIAHDLGDQRVVAYTLMYLGDYQARYEHNWPRTLDRLTESLSLARQLEDKWLTALTLELMGIAARSRGDASHARLYLEESLALSRDVGDPWLISGILDNLGSQEALAGNYGRAALLYDEGLKLRRDLKDPCGVAGILNDMGQMARYQHDYVRAAQSFEESLTLFKEYGQKESSAIVLHNLGCVTRQRGDLVRAAALFGESISIFRELENVEGIICSLGGLAAVACAEGHVEEAVKLFGAVDALLQSTGAAIPRAERAECDQVLAVAKDALPESIFAAAWADGHGMSMEHAIAEAMANAPDSFN